MISIVLMFFKTFWREAIVVLLVSGILYTGYYKVKDIGYKQANLECSQRMTEFNNSLDKLIVAIETNSTALIKESVESRVILKKDISNILSTIRNKPLFVIDQGKCMPSENFIDTYNQVIDRVNQ